MRSTKLSCRSQSAQSSACTRSCCKVTVTLSSASCLWRAYMPRVIDVQVPSAANNRSYGVGPRSEPPTFLGSSANQSWPAAVHSCTKPSARPVTRTTPRSVSG